MITWWIERFSQTFMLVETHIDVIYGILSMLWHIFSTRKYIFHFGKPNQSFFLQMSIHILQSIQVKNNIVFRPFELWLIFSLFHIQLMSFPLCYIIQRILKTFLKVSFESRHSLYHRKVR